MNEMEREREMRESMHESLSIKGEGEEREKSGDWFLS